LPDEHGQPWHLGLLSRQRRLPLRDGDIIAAEQEERFSGQKHDLRFRRTLSGSVSGKVLSGAI
jgi:hypothetical protein